jgi:hypothetical protein
MSLFTMRTPACFKHGYWLHEIIPSFVGIFRVLCYASLKVNSRTGCMMEDSALFFFITIAFFDSSVNMA